METDKIRGFEDDSLSIRDTRKESEKRLSEAQDINHTLLEAKESHDYSKTEAIDMQETAYKGDIKHFQGKRLDMAADIKDSETLETQEKKSELIEHMVQHDFPVSPEKRLDNAKDFHYLDDKEFAEQLKQRDPSSTVEDIELTCGFHDARDNQAFIKDKGDTLKTSIHEKLHQKSITELPTRFNEGITEYFARKEAGGWGELKKFDERGREIPKPLSDYEGEVDIVRKLEATIGREPLNAAYFEGKTEVLKNEVDKYLGDGAFQKISDALENRDYKSASEIIEKYYKK
jgi:hypothetical protein